MFQVVGVVKVVLMLVFSGGVSGVSVYVKVSIGVSVLVTPVPVVSILLP